MLERPHAPTSDAFAAALVDESPDALYALSLDGRVLTWNRAAEAVFGYTSAEAVGAMFEDLMVPKAHLAESRRAFALALGGSSALLQAVRRRKDGTLVYVDVSMRRVETATIAFITASNKDVTGLKRLQERLREATRRTSEFLANISHELRTPLNAVIGFAELMHHGKVGPISSVHREYLGDILTSSKHLLELIDDVLDLGKVESGTGDFRPELVDVGKLASQMRGLLRALAAGKHLRLETDIDANLGPVEVDRAGLKQVLYNYLSNAMKLTPDGGRVTLRVRGEGTECFRISVEDTGVGISPLDFGELFFDVGQLDAREAKTYQGTGLALTKRIVEAHGGHVEVSSTPAIGSIFSAILPRSQRAAVEHTDAR